MLRRRFCAGWMSGGWLSRAILDLTLGWIASLVARMREMEDNPGVLRGGAYIPISGWDWIPSCRDVMIASGSDRQIC